MGADSAAGERYPCLGGLRAVAAGSVIVFHVASFTTRFRGSSGRILVLFGMGVWVFFVISGFLLYRPFVAAHLHTGRDPDLRTYGLRRFARIYPAYWVALAFFTFVVHRASIKGPLAAVLHVALFQTYLPKQLFAGITVAWSLVAEVSFYIFLPAYSWAVGTIGRRWTPLAAEITGVVVVLAIGIGAQTWFVEGNPPAWVTAFPAYLYVFGLGMLLAVLTARPWPISLPRALANAGDHAWIWWTIGAVFLVILYSAGGGSTVGEPNGATEFNLYASRAMAAFFIVLPAVIGAQDRGAIRWLLRWAPVAYLGLVSYGLYLWHPLTIAAIQQDWMGKSVGHGNPFVLFVISVPVVVAAASASWFLVERPVLRLAHRVPPRPRDGRAAGAVDEVAGAVDEVAGAVDEVAGAVETPR